MPDPYEAEHQRLQDDVETTFLEGRTILPGAQALFGFQLSVLFTTTFRESLSNLERYVHFASLALNAVTIAVLMFPAAYHRQVTPGVISRNFIHLTNRAMQTALLILSLSMSCTMYIVTDLVFRSWVGGVVGGVTTLVAFQLLWFAWPRWARQRRTVQELIAENAEPKSKSKG